MSCPAEDAATGSLRDAAARGDEAAVAALLDRGEATAESVDGQGGQSPMQLALKGGHVGTVAALVVRGSRLAASGEPRPPGQLRLRRALAGEDEGGTAAVGAVDQNDPHALVSRFRSELCELLDAADREKSHELAEIACALEATIARSPVQQGPAKKRKASQKQAAKMWEQLVVVQQKNHEQLASIEAAALEQLRGLRQKASQLADMLSAAEKSYSDGLERLKQSNRAPAAKIEAARTQAELKLAEIHEQARSLFSEQVKAASDGYRENVTQYSKVAHHRLLKFNTVANQQIAAVFGDTMDLPHAKWGPRASVVPAAADLPSYMQPTGQGRRKPKGPPSKPKRAPPKAKMAGKGSFGQSSRFVEPKPVTDRLSESVTSSLTSRGGATIKPGKGTRRDGQKDKLGPKPSSVPPEARGKKVMPPKKDIGDSKPEALSPNTREFLEIESAVQVLSNAGIDVEVSASDAPVTKKVKVVKPSKVVRVKSSGDASQSALTIVKVGQQKGEGSDRSQDTAEAAAGQTEGTDRTTESEASKAAAEAAAAVEAKYKAL
eukprot:COSAG02_NODE_9780_length_2112_cov_1.456036_1_plen_548_part_10